MHSYTISKQLFCAAWLRVKANGGVAGVDNVSIQMFENNLKNELYKLWNRMSSGSYLDYDYNAAGQLTRLINSTITKLY